MKFLPLLLATLLLAGCAGTNKPEVSTPERPLKLFKDGNFGASFGYSQALEVRYNPRDSANLVVISWHSNLVGALHIHGLPSTKDEKDFVVMSRERYRRDYGASSVDYQLIKNSNKCRIHEFKIAFAHKGVDYIANQFVYFRPISNSDSPQAILEHMYGTFSFEFMCAETNFAALKPEINTVINSFKVEKLK